MVKVIQTITHMNTDNDLKQILSIVNRTKLDGIRFNLCKYSTQELERIVDIIIQNSRLITRDIAFDVPYPNNKTRIIALNDNLSHIKKGEVYYLIKNIPKEKFKNIKNLITVNCKKFSINKNGIIFYADGQGAFILVDQEEDYIKVKALNSFEIFPNKGIYCGFPENDAKLMSILKKLAMNFSNCAFFLSFVKNKEEIVEFKKEINLDTIKIYPKIELKEAIDNLDSLISISTGILVARGDLAMNIPYPEFNKNIKYICENVNSANKPLIFATDILRHSNMRLVPERSELNDLISIIDLGSECIVLPSEKKLIPKYFDEEIIDIINNKIKIIQNCSNNATELF